MNKQTATDFFRSILSSKGRFIAIAVIAALGTGFFAGLQMTAPDMRLSSDQYLDQTNAWDLRVASSLGVDSEMIDELRLLDGVTEVCAEREADVAASVGGVEYSVRVHSLDEGALEAAKGAGESGEASESGKSGEASEASEANESIEASEVKSMCSPILLDGRFPQNSGECLLGADAVFENPVSIGDSVEIKKMADNSNIEDTFETSTYKVVGFVRSSNYMCTTNLGTTSLGDGNLDDFMYIPMEDFDSSNPYTSAYLTVEGAKDALSGSQDYEAIVDGVKDKISEQKELLVAGRFVRVRSEGQSKIDDAKKEYEKGKQDSQAELDSAKSKLDSALSQLNSSAQKLTDGRTELNEGKSQLEAAKAELQKSRALVDGYQAQYDSGQESLTAAKDFAEAQFAVVEAQIDALEDKWKQEAPNRDTYSAQADALNTAIDEASTSRDLLQTQLDALIKDDPNNPQVAVLKSKIEELDKSILEMQEKLSALKTAIEFIDTGEAQVAQAREQLQTAREQTQAQLDESEAQLATLASEIENANQALNDGQEQIQANEEKLQQAQKELDSGQAQYNSGLSEYQSGLQEYEDGKAKAQAELDDALAKINDAQSELDSISSPELYVLDRNQNIGIASFDADATRMVNIANVFPLIFFLVAALVSLTTMTRMVDEERVLIGTYKALGYSNLTIASKYLLYALLASGIGCVVGIISLSQFLPYFIMNAYSIMYKIPATPTPIEPVVSCLASGLGIFVVLAATWWACASSLRESPAALMLPRAPKAGKRILLERIGPLWAKMSFSWKVTARNIFRYKKRFVMAIIGVAGCTALLLTGFGLSDSINDILTKQFDSQDPIFRYSITAVLDDDISSQQMTNIQSNLEANKNVSEFAFLRNDNVVATSSDDSDLSVQLVSPQNVEEFASFVDMNERISRKHIELSDGAAVISEKLANRLDISAGDDITLYEQDSVGNATGSGMTFKVGSIMECYVSNYVYVTPTDYNQVVGEQMTPNYIYVKNSDGSIQDELATDLLEIDGISIASPTDDTVAHYREALKTVDSVVLILIVAAAVLAFVVLYNLTNINIAERQREIATLKVLGFVRREVNAYIFRETLLLSAIGALVGLVLGIVLCSFVVQTAEVDQVMFGRDIHILSFIIAMVLTMVFAVLVSLLMMRKLEKISMVESLKSVD